LKGKPEIRKGPRKKNQTSKKGLEKLKKGQRFTHKGGGLLAKTTILDNNGGYQSTHRKRRTRPSQVAITKQQKRLPLIKSSAVQK